MPRKRTFNPSIPSHIDQSALPKGVYWDRSGKGRWYRFVEREGKIGRETLAGPNAKLSDLHAIVDDRATRGTIEWLCEQYHESAKFKKLAKTTHADYVYSRDVALALRTSTGSTVGKLEYARLRQAHIQRIVDRLDNEGTPTKANKVLRYLRLVFRLGRQSRPLSTQPGAGRRGGQERKLRRLPSTDVYTALRDFARDRGGRVAHTEGLVMELGYLCRLRGIETITLTEAHAGSEGLRTNRRKRSRDSLVEWTPRLRTAWDAALELRKATIDRLKRPEMLRSASDCTT